MDTQRFLVLFDERSDDVRRSHPGTIRLNLRRWFAHLEGQPTAAVLIERSGGAFNASEVFDGDELEWPADDLGLLGARLWLFRQIAEGKIDVSDVAVRWLDSAEPYDDRNCDMVLQDLFRPLARDLRRDLDGLTPQDPHATMETRRGPGQHEALIAALEGLIVALREANDGPPAEERNRYLAEITAGRTLVTAETARIEAVETVLGRAVQAIAKKFGEGLVSEAAKGAWKAFIDWMV